MRKHIEHRNEESVLTPELIIGIVFATVALLLTNACSLKWQSSDTFDREMSMIETVQKQAATVDLDSYSKREKQQLDRAIQVSEQKPQLWEK